MHMIGKISCQANTRLLCASVFLLFVLAPAVRTQAQAAARKGFDAVGGGSQSAVSFGSNGVAWRVYPPGGKPGFEATSSFQNFGQSALLRRFEGMEGKIHTQTFYKVQQRGDEARTRAQNGGTAAPQKARRDAVSSAAPRASVGSKPEAAMARWQVHRRQEQRRHAAKAASTHPCAHKDHAWWRGTMRCRRWLPQVQSMAKQPARRHSAR